LMRAVWPDSFVEEANLSYNISLIRKALGEGKNGERYIKTVPKRGYRFVGEVRGREENALPTTEEPPASQDFINDAEQLAGDDLETGPENNLPSAEGVVSPAAQLPEPSDQPSASLAAASERIRKRERFAWIVSAIFALVALISIINYFRQAPVEVRSIRALIPPPENARFQLARGINHGAIAVSPDGRHLAFVASTPNGKDFIWIRPLNVLTAQPLADTEGALSLFWSPDSQWLGFFAGRTLKKIKASGGPSIKLCEVAVQGSTGTWSPDDVIVFSTPTFSRLSTPTFSRLYQVPASGGVPSEVNKLDETHHEGNHLFPYFLPDGRHFLYLVMSGGKAEKQLEGIYVASLDNQERKLLLPDKSNVAYASGYLLFGRDRALMAQPFDTERLELKGDAFTVASQVQFHTNPRRFVFSVSQNGVLVYQASPRVDGSQLVWFDRSGRQVGVLGDPAHYRDPDLSPDGKKVAVDIRDSVTNRQDIWLYDVTRGLRTRFTSDSVPGAVPLWSPDGERLVYCSARRRPFDLHQRAANGAGTEEVLVESDLIKYPTSWSQDGRLLLYYAYGDSKTTYDMWVLPMFGERKPFLFLQTEAQEFWGEFSPDGRWIAYVSDESGQFEIYIRPFPGPGGKQQVSSAGGTTLRWRGDGKELFYLAADNKLMVVEVKISGSSLEIGALRPLFETNPAWQGRDFDVTADGQRFLVNNLVEERGSLPLTLVVNWTADLKR
jgi:eukaryotic-like serine/threonine-protein kinase